VSPPQSGTVALPATKIPIPRRELADTIRFRRRKGSVAVLESSFCRIEPRAHAIASALIPNPAEPEPKNADSDIFKNAFKPGINIGRITTHWKFLARNSKHLCTEAKSCVNSTVFFQIWPQIQHSVITGME